MRTAILTLPTQTHSLTTRRQGHQGKHNTVVLCKWYLGRQEMVDRSTREALVKLFQWTPKVI